MRLCLPVGLSYSERRLCLTPSVKLTALELTAGTFYKPLWGPRRAVHEFGSWSALNKVWNANECTELCSSSKVASLSTSKINITSSPINDTPCTTCLNTTINTTTTLSDTSPTTTTNISPTPNTTPYTTTTDATPYATTTDATQDITTSLTTPYMTTTNTLTTPDTASIISTSSTFNCTPTTTTDASAFSASASILESATSCRKK